MTLNLEVACLLFGFVLSSLLEGESTGTHVGFLVLALRSCGRDWSCSALVCMNLSCVKNCFDVAEFLLRGIDL